MAFSGDTAIESILAGTRSFVAAISPAVKSRAGGEPRVASDPRQAFIFCAENGGLLIMEYRGPEWLPLVRDLRSLCGDAISVVVAVGQEQMSEVTGLQRAGADEVVAWDGRADPVAWAVERILASKGRTPQAAPGSRGFSAPPLAPPLLHRTAAPMDAGPAPAPTPSPDPAAVPGTSPPPGEAPRSAATPGPAPRTVPVPPAAFTIREAPAADAPAAGPAPATGAWPAGVLPSPEAERLLSAVVTGAATEPGPARSVAIQTAQGLSDLERRALADIAVPVDGALVRRASALRLRVALALGSAPDAGAAIDTAAVQSLLAELDSALAELQAAAERTGPEHHPGIAVLRTALVKEAIDLTDAVHRIAPAQAPAIQATARPTTRLLSVRSGVEAAPQPPLKRSWIVLLVLAVVAAGAFHGYRFYQRRSPPPLPTFPGSPSGALGVQQGRTRVLVPSTTQPMDPAELERLKTLEQVRGNIVRQVGPDAWVIVPQKPTEGGGAP